MSIFDSIFGTNDPAAAAMKYTSQIPAVGKQYFNPYIEGGQDAGNTLKGQYGQNINDPTSLIDKIMQHYQQSQGSQYEQKQLGRSIDATAAAGGIAGTPEHQTQTGEMINGIMSKDMQQYLANALGIYNGGISGEQDIYGKGYDASKELADILGGNLASEGTMAFQGTQQSNANRQSLLSALAKALSTGAGASLGGVPGAYVGSKLFG